ncbi:hypothetical protein CSIRO_3006 [Bradyrhizobiaceae bacterium SG-6C]|nr:hypothetical protein CSIRO_3006 [Bradyrhizobiaceae bacterium SG-6C]
MYRRSFAELSFAVGLATILASLARIRKSREPGAMLQMRPVAVTGLSESQMKSS